ncbi:cell division protein ZipA [Ectothiorhodospira sp. BSL-9]|uniref:cell division protein ZipA n=1 Tax=Ectothiorhodospira sp. BSL-9 TaxID=1442136 RepID=UPI0007B44248|nr:cell division protein ZipA [Ectothiorhodospira sp. BSL-9]ANB03530.1 hypothetical protein ECTOBSL9_3208 [Ectothiorhodospira sp. BSL-9]
MDTLRWILLLLGIMILAGIYLAGRVRQPRRPRDLDDDGMDADELEHVHIRADEGFTPSSSRAEGQSVDEDPLASQRKEPVFDEVGVGEVRVVHRDEPRKDDAEPFLGQEASPDSASASEKPESVTTERPARPMRSRGHGGASRRPRGGKASLLARLKGSLPKPSMPAIKAPRMPDLGQFFRGRKAGSSQSDAALAEENEAGSTTQPEADDKIIVLHVVAPNQDRFLGVNLQAALADMGLQHGDLGIYHLNVSDGQRNFTLFSLANMVKPGTFDPETMDEFTTPGVSLFLRLPGPCDPLESFDAMLTCAEKLAERLNGQVLDASRSAVTPQGNQHTREDIRQWKLRRGL